MKAIAVQLSLWYKCYETVLWYWFYLADATNIGPITTFLVLLENVLALC